MKSTIDLAAARAVIVRARLAGLVHLPESDAKALLGTIGIATPARIAVSGPAGAEGLAEPPFEGGRVVLKAIAPGLLHKTEAGAVRVLPARREAVIAEMRAMTRRLDGQFIEGFLVEELVRYEPSLGNEFLIGLRWTADLGPVVTLSAGGIHAELLAGALRPEESLAVFHPSLAKRVAIEQALERVAAVRLATRPQRGREPLLSLASLADVVLRFLALGKAVCPDLLLELEVNPLVVAGGRLVALDAIGRLPAPERPAAAAAPPRPLEKIGRLLEPRSVALVGVSEKAVNPGRIILRNLLRAGFDPRRVVIVKPDAVEIDGVRCVPSLAALPEEPAFQGAERRSDVAVLCVSAGVSSELIETIARERRSETVILIPGGLEERAESAAMVARIRRALDEARAAEWRGPVVNGGNCLGIRSAPGKFDTFFIPEHKLPRHEGPPDPIALIAGSGAFAVSTSSKLTGVNPVFTITIGNQTDLTVADYLEHLKRDPRVEVFAIYLEGFRALDGARFLEQSRDIAASGKTVILYRGGRGPAGLAAAWSHTAVIAGDFVVASALARDAGVLVAESVDEFRDLVRLFAALRGRSVGGLSLGAVSNAGYEAVAIADHAGPLRLAAFGRRTMDAIGSALARAGLDTIVGVRNPLDLTPILDDAAYEEVVRAVLDDPAVEVGVVGCVPLTGALQTLPAGAGHSEDLAQPAGLARRLARIAAESRKAWIAVVDAGPLYDPFARAVEEGGIPTFRSSDRAMQVLGRYCEARLRQGRTAGAPPAPPPRGVEPVPPVPETAEPHWGVPLIWS